MDVDTTGIKCPGKEKRTNKWELGTDDPSTRDKEKRGKEEEKGGITNPPNLADAKGEMPNEGKEKKEIWKEIREFGTKGEIWGNWRKNAEIFVYLKKK